MTKTVLVIDDQSVYRDSICDALRMRGFQVQDAESVPTALILVARNPPDLALVDICMPDYDGIEFLRLINGRRDREKVPVILMTAQPKREYLEEAAKLGVRDFVVKSSFSIQELILRIEMRLSMESECAPKSSVPPPEPSAPVPPPLTKRSHVAARASSSGPVSSLGPISTAGPISNFDLNEELTLKRKKIASRVRSFRNLEAKALPGPVVEILQLASSMTSSLVQLESVVRRDPVLAARVLSLANSAAHRGATLVGQLDEALRNVGIDAVVEMMSGVPLDDRERLGSPPARDLAGLWWHCLATAVLSDRLAPAPVRQGAYLAGLFHDLPLLFGLQAIEDDWPEIRRNAIDEGKTPSDVVAEAFGMVQGQIAQEVYARYRLPETLAGPLRDYHNICLGRQPREAADLPRRIDASHHLAVALGWGWGELAEVRPLSVEEGRGWREGERLVVELPQIREEIAWLGQMAGLPTIEPTPQEGEWGPGAIGYWRDPRWRVPDPIEHILSRTGKLETFDTPEQLLQAKDLRKIAVVEPDSANWKTVMGGGESVLVLHKTALGNFMPPAGIRLLRVPVAIYLLRETIAGM
jgi:DNA-binding response OmpR family regulator/HD-like signal output (HDOD) protein